MSKYKFYFRNIRHDSCNSALFHIRNLPPIALSERMEIKKEETYGSVCFVFSICLFFSYMYILLLQSDWYAYCTKHFFTYACTIFHNIKFYINTPLLHFFPFEFPHPPSASNILSILPQRNSNQFDLMMRL